MSGLKKRQLTVWAAINKNGSLSLHTEEPIRNEDTGIWVSKSPFVNSVLFGEADWTSPISFSCGG